MNLLLFINKKDRSYACTRFRKWMNKILIDWGIDPTVADRFDETIIAVLMIAIAIGLNLSLPGDSYRRNEAVHPSETAPLEYVADEAQSVSQPDSYGSGFSGLFFTANGFYSWQGLIAYFPESLCRLHNLFFAVGH